MNCLDRYSEKTAKFFLLVIVASLFTFSSISTTAEESLSDSLALIEEFEKVYFFVGTEEEDPDETEKQLKQLLVKAEDFRDQNKKVAEAWIACALIRSGYASTKSLSALGMVKTARKELVAAIELNPQALDGFGQAFLGRLYGMVPPWPLSFGSKKKAKKYFQEALLINSDAVPINLYYGDFLRRLHDYEIAETYLLKAKAGIPRSNTPHWDKVLLKDTNNSLQSLRKATAKKQ